MSRPLTVAKASTNASSKSAGTRAYLGDVAGKFGLWCAWRTLPRSGAGDRRSNSLPGWLNYRERNLLGRSLTINEAR